MTWKPSQPPPGCVTAEEHEAKLVALAELLEKKANDLLSGAERIGIAGGRECAAVAARARRSAAELALAREGREHRTWMIRQIKHAESRGQERPPLRRRQQP